MSRVVNYSNKEFGKLVVFVNDNELLFLGKQVATILGYSDTKKAIRDHVDDDDKRHFTLKELKELFGGGETPPPNFNNNGAFLINESGLYSLILSSKLDTSKKFKKWVTSEVLPSIRRTGSYSINNKVELPDFTNPAEAARAWANEYEAKLLAESKVKELQPKADFYDDVAGSKDAIEMGRVAKVLDFKKIGRNKLFLFLRNKKILRSNNEPYQTYIDKGYFRVIEQKYSKPDGSICINLKTLVYQSGVEFIRKLLNDELKDNDSDQIELF